MRLFSLFFLLGTLLIQSISVLPKWQYALFILVITLAVFYFYKNKSKQVNLILISLSAFLFGLLLSTYQASRILDHRIEPDLEGQELLLTGKIVDIPSIREDGVRFLFDVSSARLINKSKTKPLDKSVGLKGIVRLGWFKNVKQLQAGEIWQLKVKLKQPSGFMNPGGFDYEKWLFTQRIIATGYVRNSKEGELQNNYKLSQTMIPRLTGSIDRWRQIIHQKIQENIENKSSAAVLSALLVAIRDKLDDSQWKLLQATGTSHLIAISGLHIAVVAGFGFFPMMLLWYLFPRLNERIPLRLAGAFIGTLLAICYAVLAGFTLPTQRALLMVIIGLWGLASRRNYTASTILALAMVLVLLWDPLAAMTASFWLSFLAVFLILFFLRRQLSKPSWMVLKLQIFISLAMLPLTLLFFGTASLTSPIANLFAIPWVSFLVVPISLLGLVLMPFSTFLSTQLLSLSAFTVELMFKGLEILGGSTLSQLSFSQIPSSLLVIVFLGVLIVMLPKGFPGRYLGFLLILPILTYQSKTLQTDEFEYTLLDVGQGYASVLRTQNHLLVYDTGTRVSDSFDLGKLVVTPYLKSIGAEKINTLMISHEDIDHRGGARYLSDNFQIDEILTSDITVIENSKACKQGQSWQWDGVNFEVLSPPVIYVGNDNNRSCVLKVWNQYHSLLLTGDIQKQTEKSLLKSHPNKLIADVMSVPHHGSKTSSSITFLKQVNPDIGLISAGYRSRFGHPKATIIKRYQALDIELLDTINHGAISLKFPADKQKIKRTSYRLDKQTFWSR